MKTLSGYIETTDVVHGFRVYAHPVTHRRVVLHLGCLVDAKLAEDIRRGIVRDAAPLLLQAVEAFAVGLPDLNAINTLLLETRGIQS